MRRTSTIQAAAAALGLLAGFALAPEGQAPLDRDVTPYAVTVAWRTGGPPELPPVAGVEVDDWGGRMAPAPSADRRVRTPAPRVRADAPEPRVRTRQAKPRATARAKAAPAPRVLRGVDLAAATFGVPRRECPREAAEAREAQRLREEARVREVPGARES